MRKRCFSKCRGLKRSECGKPCTVVNEQYCRLSSTLKMVPPDCRVVKRNSTHIHKIKTKTRSSKRSHSFSKETFSKDTFCSESGLCRGKSLSLSDYFQMLEFTYAKTVKTSPIHVIEYERDRRFAYATLHTSGPNTNVAYEYMAGQYLNELFKKTPSFLETYGLLMYPDKHQRSLVQKAGGSLASSLMPIRPDKYAMVCGNRELLCVLVQHIPSAKPLTHFVKNPHFFIHDALYVFYQVYFTLSMLRKVFTHYDLHCENVLLYQPLSQGYIEYHYHLPKEVVRFNSSYLVKLKNYSTCFFKGSKQYIHSLGQDSRCNPLEEHGFYFMKPGSEKHIYGLKKNESHDLLLLKDYQRLTRMKTHTNKYIQSFVQVFEDVVYVSRDGTPEDLSMSSGIHKVSDVEKRLRSLIQDPVRQRLNQLSYAKNQKIGELHVYTNGKELEFLSQKNM
jgi:hypothetical protein